MKGHSMPGDKLILRGLRVATHIGVYPWEQHVRQELLLDIELTLPAGAVARAASRDRVEDALDYSALAARVQRFAAESSWQLIETFAEQLAEVLLREYTLPQLLLQVHKPAALDDAQVSLCIQRSV